MSAPAKAAISAAAAALGRLGGLATKGISTPAKRRAARLNGKKGGRPRKQPEVSR